MTSSERHLRIGQPRWDYSVQRYKPDRDVFFEKGLFSILFLACGRHTVTKRCLLSTIDAVSKSPTPVEWIFMENGNDEENYNFFQSLDLERKVVIRQKNYGINNAWNQMWQISRGEWCFVHENDFENRMPNFDFLTTAKGIFEDCGDVGIIQLRAAHDPCENYGRGKPMYNPWSCSHEQNELAGIKLLNHEGRGYHSLIGRNFYGFNNNPNLIAKKLYRECGFYPEAELGCDPAHGETLYQEEVLKTECAISHICKEIYYHVGQIKTKIV